MKGIGDLGYGFPLDSCYAIFDRGSKLLNHMLKKVRTIVICSTRAATITCKVVDIMTYDLSKLVTKNLINNQLLTYKTI